MTPLTKAFGEGNMVLAISLWDDPSPNGMSWLDGGMEHSIFMLVLAQKRLLIYRQLRNLHWWCLDNSPKRHCNLLEHQVW